MRSATATPGAASNFVARSRLPRSRPHRARRLVDAAHLCRLFIEPRLHRRGPGAPRDPSLGSRATHASVSSPDPGTRRGRNHQRVRRQRGHTGRRARAVRRTCPSCHTWQSAAAGRDDDVGPAQRPRCLGHKTTMPGSSRTTMTANSGTTGARSGPSRGLTRNGVLYAGTASKSLGPGLHLSWLVVPHGLRRDLATVTICAPGSRR